MILSVFFITSCSDNLEIVEDNTVYKAVGNNKLGYFNVDENTQVKDNNNTMEMKTDEFDIIVFDLKDYISLVTNEEKADLSSALHEPNNISDEALKFISAIVEDEAYVENTSLNNTYGILLTIDGEYNKDLIKKLGFSFDAENPSIFLSEDDIIILIDGIDDNSSRILTSYIK